ncbi:MAG: hypothetical protein IT372_22660 [Polyangiaceae bacterium]|nr:hypothetical protein [Polyangiaceae bacterium]
MRHSIFFLAMGICVAACGGDEPASGGGGGGAGHGGAGGAAGGTSAGGGGAGQGGAAGHGGQAGHGGGSAAPECEVDSDCIIVNDCCTCEGMPKGSVAPDCPIQDCFVPTCESLGLSTLTPTCNAGRCVAGHRCDPAEVLCNALPPPCEAGKIPAVSGACWGGCVAPTECATVGSCDQCGPGLACVAEVGFAADFHCVDVPEVCGSAVDCGCVGASACVEPFTMCVQASPAELHCECPNC